MTNTIDSIFNILLDCRFFIGSRQFFSFSLAKVNWKRVAQVSIYSLWFGEDCAIIRKYKQFLWKQTAPQVICSKMRNKCRKIVYMFRRFMGEVPIVFRYGESVLSRLGRELENWHCDGIRSYTYSYTNTATRKQYEHNACVWLLLYSIVMCSCHRSSSFNLQFSSCLRQRVVYLQQFYFMHFFVSLQIGIIIAHLLKINMVFNCLC